MTISATELQSIQQAATAAYHAAQHATGGAGGLLDDAYRDAKQETSAAADNDAKAVVARKFSAIFAAFGLFSQDDNHTMSIPVWSGIRAENEARKRAVLDRHPATAAWAVARDERAAALQARIDLNAANLAERLNRELPAMLLGRIRAASGDLMLGPKGALMATAGTSLDVGYGTAIYADRKAEFVAILRAEADAAAAEAKRLAPVVIA